MSSVSPNPIWPYCLAQDLPSHEKERIRLRADELEAASQYGWGHTIDFGIFAKPGFLGDAYLHIAELLDRWEWWPKDLTGMRVADVGCFTGGLSLVMAARNPASVFAVDEVPEHLRQCEFLCKTFGVSSVGTHETSLYSLPDHVEPESLDMIILSGVLYHLSDMLLGLLVLRSLLRPNGVLLIETTAVDDDERSYADFGRFYAGMWWRPTGRCIKDMCGFMGFDEPEVRFYEEQRCLVRTIRTEGSDIPFKRGINFKFDDIRDLKPRSLDPGIMAPAR